MYRTRFSILLLLLVITLSQSCKNSLKDDKSLTIEEYMKLGIPDPSKVWTAEDYLKSNMTLNALRIKDNSVFPRKRSKRSGVLFERMLSKDNLAFTEDTRLPAVSRAYMVQHYPKFQYEMTQLYLISSNEEHNYSEELIDTYIFGLYIQGRMLKLAGTIMNSASEKEKSIQGGLSTVVYNYLKTLSNIMEEQVKAKQYGINDLDRMSLEVASSIKENFEWILPADRIKLISMIDKVIDQSPSDFIKDNYRKSRDTLKGK